MKQPKIQDHPQNVDGLVFACYKQPFCKIEHA